MRIIAFGDSFVVGAGDPEHLGWIGRALAGRREVTLYNLGVRGDTSAGVAARLAPETQPRLPDAEPCRIVLAFGVNDTWEDDAGQRIAPAQTLLNTRAAITSAARLAPVLFVGPPPVPEPGRSARIEAMNETLKLLCARTKTRSSTCSDRSPPMAYGCRRPAPLTAPIQAPEATSAWQIWWRRTRPGAVSQPRPTPKPAPCRVDRGARGANDGSWGERRLTRARREGWQI